MFVICWTVKLETRPKSRVTPVLTLQPFDVFLLHANSLIFKPNTVSICHTYYSNMFLDCWLLQNQNTRATAIKRVVNVHNVAVFTPRAKVQNVSVATDILE